MDTALFVAAFLLFAYAVAVRFAGTAKILNFVDYGRIQDRVALHTWVGNRLLSLAFVTLALATLILMSALPAIFCLLGFIMAVIVVVGWLVLGADKFRSER